eukprot:14592636-Alexandrium_andersonii.AAC.1
MDGPLDGCPSPQCATRILTTGTLQEHGSGTRSGGSPPGTKALPPAAQAWCFHLAEGAALGKEVGCRSFPDPACEINPGGSAPGSAKRARTWPAVAQLGQPQPL